MAATGRMQTLETSEAAVNQVQPGACTGKERHKSTGVGHAFLHQFFSCEGFLYRIEHGFISRKFHHHHHHHHDHHVFAQSKQ